MCAGINTDNRHQNILRILFGNTHAHNRCRIIGGYERSCLFNKVAGLRLWHRCFPANFVKFLRPPFFIEHLWWLLQQIYWSGVISGFSYPFKLFSILNFAMAECFCHVTCFSMVYLILFFLFFFHGQTWYFYNQKVVTWKLQHFYHKEVMMLSLLYHWELLLKVWIWHRYQNRNL